MTLPIEIDIWQGSIADLEVDAIIIPANESLFMTGPIGAAVKLRAGDGVELEAVDQGPVPTGSVVVTGGGLLAAQWILHAVAVGHDLKPDPGRLESAIGAAFDAAGALGVSPLAMTPLGIERGVFTPDEAATAVARVVADRAALLGRMRSLVIAVASAVEVAAYRAALAALQSTA